MARSSDTGDGGLTQEQHVLRDFLRPNMVTVFCGSGISKRSAAERKYYATIFNKFWRLLFEIKLTPRKFTSNEYLKLAELRIGLADLTTIQPGRDEAISPAYEDPDGLYQKIETYRPRILAFTGKRPARVVLEKRFGVKTVNYGPQPEDRRLGDTEVFVLPSPSGENRHWQQEGYRPRYTRFWLELAKRHRKLLAEE